MITPQEMGVHLVDGADPAPVIPRQGDARGNEKAPQMLAVLPDRGDVYSVQELARQGAIDLRFRELLRLAGPVGQQGRNAAGNSRSWLLVEPCRR
jgi:hypothetical protein